MADASPIAPDHLHPAPRPLTPIWSRRWVGFPAAPPPPIGRTREVAALCDLLLEPGRRLVTVTGPGGVGKTRLALAAAERMTAHFGDGAAFVALADTTDPAAIPAAIARVLELRESPGRTVQETLTGAMRDRRLLLVLDNFEHLAGATAAADVSALSAACPDLTILVTSRVPLHLYIEQVFTTPALAVPDTGIAPDPDTVAGYGAVALFVERARMANHEFVLTAENAAAVVEICRRLDGLPLAIELAAAWARALPPAALLARLEPRLPLLRGGAADRPDRFRTMRDAIAWSYALLSDREQRFFRGLGVFVGGCTLEAADILASDARRPSPETLDLLATLVDKSLAQQIAPDPAEPRFAMLDTVCEFARERLQETGEDETVGAAHAAYYLALAETAAGAAGGAASGSWMRRLGIERPNLLAALERLERASQTAAALQMTGALWHYWYRLGDLAEGRARLERALAAAPAHVDPALRARALRGAGVLAWQSGDYDVSRERLQAALVAYDAIGDRTGAAWVLNSLGCLFATLADGEQAEHFLTASLALFQEHDDAGGAAQLTANLGELAEAMGRHDLASERLQAALAMWNALGDRVGAARTQVYLGQALLAQGETARAESILLDALAAIRDIDYEQILPAALRIVAQLAARRGEAATAARWYGAEDELRRSLGIALPAARSASHERAVSGVRNRLGPTAFTAAWTDGRLLSPTQALAEVLAGADLRSGAHPASGSSDLAPDSNLSPREQQVLALLVEGRSDREIAAALFISQRTASTHVGSILHKLDVGTRAEAAVKAVREGLS